MRKQSLPAAFEPPPGGGRLRALRRQAGKTQLWVEGEAALGSGYLQRLECGRVAQPERATLERILTALGARYSERRDVLECFGYAVRTPLPTPEDFAWARHACRRELAAAAFPAYLLDCSPRLVAWNRLLPPLLGVSAADPRLEQLAAGSFLGAWFEPDSLLAPLVVEPRQFLPALIRALRYESEPFHAEPWHADQLARLWQALPLFRHYWEKVVQEPAPVSADRPLAPVRLAVPGAGVLEFRLTSERFTRDARFRLIYYLPANPETMGWCAEQVEHAALVTWDASLSRP
ncbi:MAG TPA: helix-turn-helix domain-containing protein [Dehalococcoidia bacterium]|nr:helix-turn-helix domain-containing protein [Dehalococcoidia bacterium]